MPAIRALILWLLMLTVPLQGVAAATMLVCADTDQTVLSVAGSAQHMHADVNAEGHSHTTVHDIHHGSHKCAACGACCLGAIAPPVHQLAGAHAGSDSPAASSLPFVTEVTHAVPERPPRLALV
ncbi:hypothetical protein E4L96_19795 [Massilia arenosa]|uniref:DUF2946 domain-containing protein n=1 Tax=Zemynaea arenosa TaxID=2561931 RepID=A0A4Y9RW79_9BURK|nr:hypothetical protein [Massilia arenosa]TFW13344.1 hypothetical protein E4L96_19795 [Massilia arenosa]